MDPRVTKLAEVLTGYSLDLKEGETLMIMGDVTTMPLIKECYREALKKGALPQLRIMSDELQEVLLKDGQEEQIKYVPDNLKHVFENVDVLLSLWGSANTRMLSGVDPERSKWAAQGKGELLSIMFERMAKDELRWCGTVFPNQASAQEGSMSLNDYEEFVYSAGEITSADPVAYWKNVKEEQDKICAMLDTKDEIRIVAKDTDLTLKVGGRKWVNCCGEQNFPDGEVFTGPVEDSAEGHIRFSFPGIRDGREIKDIRLKFEKGKVVEASAAVGEEYLLQLLDTDEGARYLGELGIGTNHNIQTFTRHMLFDEKIGGTVHLAVGRSIPESKGTNQSAIHWDMLCDLRDGGEIYADGELIYKEGKFLL